MRQIVYFALAIAITALSGWSAYRITDGFINRQQASLTQRNELCKEKGAPHYCRISNAPQFKKFLWFVTDGLSMEYSQDLFNYYGEHGIIYGIFVPGAKYSHAIYSSWLTGQGTYTNYKGNPIEGDNLIERMAAAGIKLKYTGPEWSFLAVSGQENYHKLYDEIDIRNEPLDAKLDHSYPFFFENATALYDFEWEFLPELVYKNQSLIAHSGVFDHINHGVFRYKGDEKRLTMASKITQEDLKSLKRFIDENPEYLLILSSDHGVDAYMNGMYVLHGVTEGGNEGYLLFYNPLLSPYRQSVIDVVDVAPTIAKFLTGVDIPFNSIGIAETVFGANFMPDQMKLLQQNLKQIYQGSLSRGREPPVSKEAVKNQLKVKYSAENMPTEKQLMELYSLIVTIKSSLYDEMDAPTTPLIVISALFCVVFLTCLVVFSGRYLKDLLLRGEFTRFLSYSILLVIIYFAPFSALLFSRENYGMVFRKGTIFFLPSSFLAFLSIFLCNRQLQRHSTMHSTISFNLLGPIVTAISIIVFISESFNWIVLSLSLTLGSDWKSWFSSQEWSGDFTYVFAGAFLFYYFVWLEFKIHTKGRSFIGFVFTSFRFWGIVYILVLLKGYEWTEGIDSWYKEEFGGFHLLIVIAVLSGVLMWAVHIVTNRTFQGILIVANLMLFILWLDSTTGRLLHLLYNVQICLLYGPLLELSFFYWKTYTVSNGTEILDKKQRAMYLIEGIEASLFIQSVAIYFINSVFYHLAVNMGDSVSLEVHPFAGRVGVRSYDEYPTLAGFCMIFHKYAVFLIWLVYGLIASLPSTVHIPVDAYRLLSFRLSQKSPFSRDICKGLLKGKALVSTASNLSEKNEDYSMVSDGAGHTTTISRFASLKSQPIAILTLFFLLFYAASTEAHHLLLLSYTPLHAIEDSMIFNITWAGILGTFCIFAALENVINFRPVHVIQKTD